MAVVANKISVAFLINRDHHCNFQGIRNVRDKLDKYKSGLMITGIISFINCGPILSSPGDLLLCILLLFY